MITIEWRRPWMYRKQLDAIFCPERIAVIEASTKSGKTVGCLSWLIERAWQGRDGQNFWWTAPVFNQAMIAFRRAKRALPRDTYRANESRMTITLLNGAELWFKSADNPDSLYGEDVWALVIDEASRCKEESWHAARTTVTATRAPIRIIGNVKGKKNWAWRLARRAEAGEPGMRFTRITAFDAVEAGVFTAQDIEEARRDLPPAVFLELFMAQAADDGTSPFVMSRAPLSDAMPVVWGLDLAKSVDWTVLIGLDERGRVADWHRWQAPWPDTIERVQAIVRGAPCLVDSTGVGDPVLEALQRTLWAGMPTQFEGYVFSGPKKQQLMEGLAVATARGEVAWPEGTAIDAEMESFEFEYTRTGVRYAAPEGMHDDCVCALALADRLRTRVPAGPIGW